MKKLISKPIGVSVVNLGSGQKKEISQLKKRREEKLTNDKKK